MADRVERQQRQDRGLDREDIEAVLEVRRELGASYEPALVDSFAERIERVIDSRVEARLAQERGHGSAEGQRRTQQMVLGIVSLGTGIPITAVAGVQAGLPGVVAAWAGIAAVNAANALAGRPRR